MMCFHSYAKYLLSALKHSTIEYIKYVRPKVEDSCYENGFGTKKLKY